MTSVTDYPYADTPAARMLSSGLQQTVARTGMSIRQLGKAMGYKQAVVLSHMALGRVPIPIDRATDLADALEIDPRDFLAAVLDQRHPDINWSLLGASDAVQSMPLVTELTAGRLLDELTPGQRQVIREAAADTQAQRRWLTVHETGVVDLLRELRPSMQQHGLSRSDLRAIRQALATSESRR
ncbi:hypothetical protein ACFO8O_00010 [Hephaestia sp. GCM10023244]|uniref:hypothetical protein n=1 Tax=unclassified Hephaestia TaxID=2631281 RepID=UPI0020775A3F|nr:hypothetical protein [Hephaestia sp. MAHUQ-44]MCM8729350.1 hypothetical protein [Hephaestia sp. MAHUQ-44]